MLPPIDLSRPAIVFSSVLLPAPFEPSTATSSRSRTASAPSHSTCTSPYATAKWSTASSGVAPLTDGGLTARLLVAHERRACPDRHAPPPDRAPPPRAAP